jgi:hypothetical protein
MMKKTVSGWVKSFAVAGLILAAAATSEASTILLADGASSLDLCVPESPTVNSCGTTGLSNWVVNGSASLFSQWFSIGIAADPAWGSTSELAWSGPIDAISAPTVTQSSPSTASVSYVNWNMGTWPDAATPLQIGLRVDYAFTGAGSGPSHVSETVTLFNPTYYFLFAALTDGIGVDVHNYYVHPYSEVTLATADYTPNPEPMSLILLGTGLLAVARARRRQTAIA